MLTAERVREVLNYDPETGVFTWRKNTGRKAKVGKVAGCATCEGRTAISVDKVKTRCHRLAWLWMTGEFPAEGMTIDHINGDATDNRWSNLRLATKTENQGNRRTNTNNKCGVKGVHWHPQSGKWCARIRVRQRNKHIGLFDDKYEAGRAYMAAAERHFGEFAYDGRRN